MGLYTTILTLSTASSYVGAIYFFIPQDLKSKDRNDLDVVKFRIGRILKLSLFLLLLLPNLVEGGYFNNIRFLGVLPGYSLSDSLTIDLFNVFKTLYFILMLYSSSIYQILLGELDLFDDDDDKTWLHISRDYILGPITEELIYRGLIMMILKNNNNNNNNDTLYRLSPFLFGIAHLHHGIQLYFQGHKLMEIFIVCGFQLLYTSIFGMVSLMFYHGYMNNLWACIVLHSVCNLFGIPSFHVESKKMWVRVVYYFLIFFGIVHSFIFVKTL
ncbi:RCE1 CAAX prenyl protease 2 [Candida maltosa Xu316]